MAKTDILEYLKSRNCYIVQWLNCLMNKESAVFSSAIQQFSNLTITKL